MELLNFGDIINFILSELVRSGYLKTLPLEKISLEFRAKLPSMTKKFYLLATKLEELQTIHNLTFDQIIQQYINRMQREEAIKKAIKEAITKQPDTMENQTRLQPPVVEQQRREAEIEPTELTTVSQSGTVSSRVGLMEQGTRKSDVTEMEPEAVGNVVEQVKDVSHPPQTQKELINFFQSRFDLKHKGPWTALDFMASAGMERTPQNRQLVNQALRKLKNQGKIKELKLNLFITTILFEKLGGNEEQIIADYELTNRELTEDPSANIQQQANDTNQRTSEISTGRQSPSDREQPLNPSPPLEDAPPDRNSTSFY